MMEYFKLKYKEFERFIKIKEYFCYSGICKENCNNQLKKQFCLEHFKMLAIGDKDLKDILKYNGMETN